MAGNVGDMNTSYAVNAESIAAEWQRRCRRYRSWNRVWVIVAVVWLGAIGVTFLFGVLRDSAGFLYAGVLFVSGFPVFAIASLGMYRLLRCPQCGHPQKRRGFAGRTKPEAIAACEACSTRLA